MVGFHGGSVRPCSNLFLWRNLREIESLCSLLEESCALSSSLGVFFMAVKEFSIMEERGKRVMELITLDSETVQRCSRECP